MDATVSFNIGLAGYLRECLSPYGFDAYVDEDDLRFLMLLSLANVGDMWIRVLAALIFMWLFNIAMFYTNLVAR